MAVPPDDHSLQGFSRRRMWWLGGSLVVALVIAAVIGSIVVSGRAPAGQTPADGPSSAASESASASSEPAPSGTPPTPDGTESAAGSPTPVVAPIEETRDVIAGVQVRLDRFESVEATSNAPGDVGGPAVRFAVVVTNSSAESVSLQTAVVTVDYGAARTPASDLPEPGGAPLGGRVEPGDTVEGVYIFTVPAEERGLVRITVDYAADVPPLLFEGSVPA